ncbi:hypothetical protein FISHEDRAFT_59950, partial [Fistulina hepatica ATCC 64428]
EVERLRSLADARGPKAWWWTNIVTSHTTETTSTVHTAETLNHLRNGDMVLYKANSPWDVEPVTDANQFIDCVRSVGMAMEGVIEVHDMLRRHSNFTNPQRQMTILDMCRLPDSIDNAHSALDLPCSANVIPPIINCMDDGFNSWLFAKRMYPSVELIPFDSALVRSWSLLNKAGFFTWAHNDAAGLNTWVKIIKGCKIWAVTRPQTHTSRSLQDIVDSQEDYQYSLRPGELEDDELSQESMSIEELEAADNKWHYPYTEMKKDADVVDLHPGDVLIQPGGVWHEVYSPVPSIAVGGHLICIDTMHYMAITRWYHAQCGKYITNTDHTSVQMTLIRIIVRIPFMERKTFPKKAIGALCHMVLHPDVYLSQTQREDGASSVQRFHSARWQKEQPIDGDAARLARRLLKFCQFRDNLQDILWSEGEDWREAKMTVDFQESL